MHHERLTQQSRCPARDERISCATGVAILVLAVLAAVYAAWPIRRMFLPLEIDSNEPWNAYHVDDIIAGRSLYPGADALVLNNYPPLSFYLVSAISKLGFDPLYVGRALSLIAVVFTAWAAACIVRRFGGSRTAAWLAALWFCATFARFFDNYVGMNDPNLAALALMAWALVWLLRRQSAGRSAEPAILLMVVAGFTKHNLFVIPVTAICWLGLVNLRVAARAAVVGIIAATLGLVLCRVVYGEVFVQNLFTAREYRLASAVLNLGRLQWIAPALVVFGIWAWHQRQSAASGFCMLFVGIAFVFQFLEKLTAGGGDNAQFELATATAIGLGLAFDNLADIPAVRRFGIERSQLAVVAVLILRLLLSGRTAPYLLIASPEFRADLVQRADVVASETARVAAMPGPVACSVVTVCRWAGKPFLYDRFALHDRIVTGHLSEDEVERRRRALGIRLVEIDARTIADWR